ncbi:hypothetical protein L1887_39184 [Cichorium endivia]|nr:hypothetical protein L1887_39184 [Cichorium endivia]
MVISVLELWIDFNNIDCIIGFPITTTDEWIDFNNIAMKSLDVEIRVPDGRGGVEGMSTLDLYDQGDDEFRMVSLILFRQPLKAALLINYDPTGPSRLLSTILLQVLKGVAHNYPNTIALCWKSKLVCPKFKNTAATAVDLDDDDDFVSPPRETKLADERVLEITSGPTVKKGKEKRSKRKFENAPSHLKLKLKGKISEIPESKKNDTKKDKRKKVDTEYRPGLRRLSTRMKPGRICEAAAGLSPEQREAVEKWLIYVYNMKYETIPLNKRPPFIVRVTTKILTAVENFEINSGGFGKRQSDLRDEEYPSEPDVDIDEMVKDFADEEAFCAIVDIGFKKILKEKENMEIALCAG